MSCKIAVAPAEVEGHFAVRHSVFVEEQAMFAETDRDEFDGRAIHLIAIDDATGEVVGAVRCYREADGTWFGGRLAVVPEYRKSAGSIGSALCRLAVSTMDERAATLFLARIQLQNVRFFERMRWRRQGEPVMHCGELHQMMRAPLRHVEDPRQLLAHGQESEDGSRVADRAR